MSATFWDPSKKWSSYFINVKRVKLNGQNPHHSLMSIQKLIWLVIDLVSRDTKPKLSTAITFYDAQLTKQIIIIDVKVNDAMIFPLEQKTKRLLM